MSGRPQTWTAERIIAALRAWTATHDGTPPRARDWPQATSEHPHKRTVQERFGTWSAALRAADLDAPDTPSYGPRAAYGTWDRAAIIEAIVEWTDQHGQPPSMMDWSPPLAIHHGYPDRAERFRAQRPAWPYAAQVQKRFGTWNAAILAAEQIAMPSGIRRNSRAGRSGQPVHAWTRARVVDAIHAWACQHGRPPVYGDWWPRAQPDPRWPSMRTVTRCCGSFGAALRAAGYQPGNRGPQPKNPTVR